MRHCHLTHTFRSTRMSRRNVQFGAQGKDRYGQLYSNSKCPSCFNVINLGVLFSDPSFSE